MANWHLKIFPILFINRKMQTKAIMRSYCTPARMAVIKEKGKLVLMRVQNSAAHHGEQLGSSSRVKQTRPMTQPFPSSLHAKPRKQAQTGPCTPTFTQLHSQWPKGESKPCPPAAVWLDKHGANASWKIISRNNAVVIVRRRA